MEIRDDRLTITSRAEAAFCELEDDFSSLYCREEFERVLKNLRHSSPGSRKSRVLPILYKMLDACNIAYEENREDAYYENLVDSFAASGEFGRECLEDRMVLAMYKRFTDYSTPAEYMSRLLNRLQEQEDQEKWNTGSLRLRILKQFIKYGNYLEDAGYGSRPMIENHLKKTTGIDKKVISAALASDLIDENIFSGLSSLGENDNARNARKPSGRFGLLKLCDDLAEGKFRTQGGTKKGLYLLAMSLNMRLAGFPGANEENDVLKNIFMDYYTNNLMRYMTDAYRGHAQEYENPSGQGINFKNFAEVVYLYYIAKDSLKPQEKIRLSCQMIEDLTQAAKERREDGKRIIKESKETKAYKRFFIRKETEKGTEF